MNVLTLRPCNNLYNNSNHYYNNSQFYIIKKHSKSPNNGISYLFRTSKQCISIDNVARPKKLVTRAYQASSNGSEEEGETRSESRGFLSVEEAGLVEISGLNTHERFLCRLTISSLNLLKVIAEQEECTIEELNAGKVCDWFLKDKLKREQNIGTSVLQWDDDPFEDFI